MKRVLQLLIVIFACVPVLLSAQPKMSVESFKRYDNDMDARVNGKKDLNGFVSALIKIETTERDLAFDVGSLGIVDTDYSQTAEVWVYVPKGVIRIDIKNNDLGILEYEFPESIAAGTVYKMKLTTAKRVEYFEQDAGGQYLMISTYPEQVQLVIDGGDPQTVTGGAMNIFLPYGDHNYQVSSRLYKSSAGVFTIGSERAELAINLEPNFGYLNVNSTPAAADVEVNGIVVGKTPYTSDRLPLGEYNLRILAPNSAPYSQVVTLVEGEESVEVNHSLVSYFSNITVNCPMSDASIYINEELRGRGSWSGDLLPGTYELKVAKDSHRPLVKALVVQRNTPQVVNVDAPMPIYGILRIEELSFVSGVDIQLNGMSVGSAPNVLDKVLVGDYTLSLIKDGYRTHTEQITVIENKIVDVKTRLEKIVSGRVNITAASGVMLYDNGVMLSSGSYSGDLELGSHTIEAIDMFGSTSKTLVVGADGVASLDFISEKLSVEGDPQSTISINGKVVGVGSWSGEVLSGSYVVSAKSISGKVVDKIATVSRGAGARVDLKQYGFLSITTKPSSAKVEITPRPISQNGNLYTVEPGVVSALVTNHKYEDSSEVYQIKAGQTHYATIALKRKPAPFYGRNADSGGVVLGYNNITVGDVSVNSVTICALRFKNVEYSWLGVEVYDIEPMKDFYINNDMMLYDSLLEEVDEDTGDASTTIAAYRLDLRYLIPLNKFAALAVAGGASCSKYTGYGIAGASLRIKLMDMIYLEPVVEYRGLLNSDSYGAGLGYGIGLSLGL